MNSELLKYLFLQKGKMSWGAVLLFIALVNAIAYAVSSETASLGTRMQEWNFWLILWFGVIYGSKVVSEAFLKEHSEGTWIEQRMSAISPRDLFWGKWLGEALLPVGAVLFCLLLSGIGALLADTIFPWLRNVSVFVSATFLGHSCALWMGTVLLRKYPQVIRISSFAIWCLACVISIAVIAYSGYWWQGLLAETSVLQQYAPTFIACYGVAWASWATIQNVSRELGYHVQSWPLALWISGFALLLSYSQGYQGLHSLLYFACWFVFLLSLFCGYGLLWMRENKPLYTISFWKPTITDSSFWWLARLMFLSSTILVVGEWGTWWRVWEIKTWIKWTSYNPLFSWALLGLFFRDSLLCFYWEAKDITKRRSKLIMSFAILYVFAPAFLSVFDGIALWGVFWPIPKPSFLHVAVIFGQAALVFVACQKIKKVA